MTFLDASVIVDMLDGVPETVEYVQERGTPYLTSSICVLEVLHGRLGVGETDIVADGTFVPFEESGHVPFLEESKRFDDELVAFLEG
jgi:predicted nucleic acid-binding protein